MSRTLKFTGIALVVLLGVLAYQWRDLVENWRQWRTNPSGHSFFAPARVEPVEDAALLKELAEATLIEEDLPAESSGWPQWRGPGRNGIARGDNLLATWPERGPPLAWQNKVGESYSSFVGDRKRAYTLVREDNEEVALCWDLATGKEIWRYPYKCPFRESQGSGPRSTPSFVDGKLYTVGATGLFHCLDATTGKLLWKKDVLKDFQAPNPQYGVAFSPLVEHELIFTNPGGPKKGSFAAFRKDNGDLVWKSEGDGAGYSSPVTLTFGDVRQVLFFTNASLVGVAADTGKFLWRYGWPVLANAATPIIISGRTNEGQPLVYVFISSNYGKGCALLKMEHDDSGEIQARPVYANAEMQNHFSTCVRRGDYLYGFNEDRLTCLNVRSGKAVWKKPGFQKGSLARAGDRLIVLGETGRLALAKADPKEFEELAAFKPLHRRCWTVPVLLDGRLIVRDEDTVKCFDLRAAQ